MEKSKKYYSIDIAKFIFAFFVVAIHCRPFESIHPEIDFLFDNVLMRLAVPFFFLASGFFFFCNLRFKNDKVENCTENRHRLKKYLLRISILYISWSLIYLCYRLISGDLSFSEITIWLSNFFLSGSFFHLWYILTTIYAVLLGYLLLSVVKIKYIPYIIAALYLFGMLKYSYYWIGIAPISSFNSFVAPAKDIYTAMTRALPLMLLGFLVGKCDNKKPSKKALCLLFSFCFVCLTLEVKLINLFTINQKTYSYVFFTVPCAIFLFKLIYDIDINIPTLQKNAPILRHLSTILYCCHLLPITILEKFPTFVYANSLLKYSLVVILSLGLSVAIYALSKTRWFSILKWLY